MPNKEKSSLAGKRWQQKRAEASPWRDSSRVWYHKWDDPFPGFLATCLISEGILHPQIKAFESDYWSGKFIRAGVSSLYGMLIPSHTEF